jgi:ankyrin repeat protein
MRASRGRSIRKENMNNSRKANGRAILSLVAAGALAVTLAAGAALAADPVQARKDLKAMGVEYTEQDFAKVAGNGDMPATQLFLDAGMDVNAGGGAAIGLAAGRGQGKMVQFLLSKGAKPTSNSLQFARTRGHSDIEKMLKDAGAKE